MTDRVLGVVQQAIAAVGPTSR